MAIEKNLDRNELATLVAVNTNVDKEFVQRILGSFFSELRTGLAKTGYAEIAGLGSFRIVDRAARSGVTPGGNPYSIGKRKTVKFEAFADLRADIEQESSIKCI